MNRKPIGLTAPYRPKTVLAPDAPWPDPNPKAKPKVPPPARVTGRSAKVDQKFEQWPAANPAPKLNTNALQKVSEKKSDA